MQVPAKTSKISAPQDSLQHPDHETFQSSPPASAIGTTKSNGGKSKLIKLGLFAFCAFAAMAYLLCSPLVSRNLYYCLLFYAAPYPYGNYDDNVVDGIKAKDVFFKTTDNHTLHGWYFKKPGTKSILLMNHGNGGNISILQWYVDVAMRANASIFIYDYEGYGRSEGNSSIEALNRDSEAAYDYVTKTEHWKANQIINLGLSLGTGVASELNATRKCAGTILIAPFTNIRRIAAQVLPFLALYPDCLWAEHDLGSRRFISSKHHPVLILHGEQDELVPFQNALDLKAISNGPLKLVKLQCAHNDLGREHERIVSNIKKFVAEVSNN